jgi:replicative DNA helicase
MKYYDKVSTALQENLLCLLVHDDKHGKVISNMVDVELFEGDYRMIAEKAMTFWRQHREAPKLHMPDLLADILEDKDNRRAPHFRNLLDQMLELTPTVNREYAMSEIRQFVYTQRMKIVIMDSADLISQKQHMATEEVEGMWRNLMQARQLSWDGGIRLTDVDKLLDWMHKRQNEFVTGIKILDKRGIVPARGTLFLLVAGTGKGKTWGLIHLGKHALKLRKKVLHISLEMGEEETLLRYVQSLFAVPMREGQVELTKLKFDTETNQDDEPELIGFDHHMYDPKFNLGSHYIRDELETHIGDLGRIKDYLIVKSFPMRSLTLNQLTGTLDALEMNESFVPDLMVLDSPYLMNIPTRDYRIKLGRMIEDVKGLAAERNIAVVGGHQLNRFGAKSELADLTDIGEDWSVVQTADKVAIYGQTAAEYEYNLARLFIAKARQEADKQVLLMTQNYTIGQFCLNAHLMPKNYWDVVKQPEAIEDDGTDESEDE